MPSAIGTSVCDRLEITSCSSSSAVMMTMQSFQLAFVTCWPDASSNHAPTTLTMTITRRRAIINNVDSPCAAHTATKPLHPRYWMVIMSCSLHSIARRHGRRPNDAAMHAAYCPPCSGTRCGMPTCAPSMACYQSVERMWMPFDPVVPRSQRAVVVECSSNINFWRWMYWKIVCMCTWARPCPQPRVLPRRRRNSNKRRSNPSCRIWV
mmetsp:Transcript_22713/g.34936  ORF Transcript_22713/g.34936 Transcript_22713/m.34936 type:complete len:208 (+) Transcript_22713:3491-4114(+)